MNHNEYVTHKLNGVYKNTNTGVEFTATVDEKTESVGIEKEHTRPTASFTSEMDLSEFNFNATITGAYTQIQTEVHKTITTFSQLLLQDSISVRTLEELIRCEGIALTTSDVTGLEMPESSEIRTERVNTVFNNFVDYGVAEQVSPNTGDETAYRLDTDHPISEHLLALQAKLAANNEMIRETIKSYTTGFWSPSQFGWFTELFHQQSLQNAIMFLLGYPGDEITIKTMLNHSDVYKPKQEDVVTALLDLKLITTTEETVRNESIEEIKNRSVTVNITHSILSQLQHALYGYHAQNNKRNCTKI